MTHFQLKHALLQKDRSERYPKHRFRSLCFTRFKDHQNEVFANDISLKHCFRRFFKKGYAENPFFEVKRSIYLL